MKIRNRIVASLLITAIAGGMALSPAGGFFAAKASVVQAEEMGLIQLLNLDSQWRYLDDGTDPASGSQDRTSWTAAEFDDASWKTNEGKQAKFGAKRGGIADLGGGNIPEVLLNQYKEDGTTDIEAFFFRTSFELAAVPEGMELTGTLRYDDSATVYLNGVKIAGYDDTSINSNLSYGGSNAGDPIEATFTVDTANLKAGKNVLAVEVHQGRASSSDIYFELSNLSLTEKEVTAPDSITQKALSLTVGEDETSRNLTWYADVEEAGTVQYAAKSGDTFPETFETAQAVAMPANEEKFYSNQAVLIGLKADTEYVYRLVNQKTISETYTFKTGKGGAFSFLVAGDPQIGTGDLQNGINGWEDTLTKIKANFPNAEFLISAGDQVDAAANETQYAGYLEHAALPSLTTATVIGNHDSGSNAYSQHFNNPNESTYGTTNAGSDYWYTYNNVLFLNLNSNDRSVAEHQQFMKEAIGANPGVDWKIVVFHHSVFSAASHAYDDDILQRREAYVPVFDELGIDVVLMGHDHVYVRSYMMDGLTPENTELASSVTDPEGILYMTLNSASGSKYYNLKNEEFDYAAVKNQERVPNISNVEMTENTFKITTYRTSDMSVVDSFEIVHSPKTLGTTRTIPSEKIEGFNNKDASLAVEKVGTYDSDVQNKDGGSAEIVQYNSGNGRYYVVNGTSGTLDIVPRAFYEEGNPDSEGVKLNLKRIMKEKAPEFQYGDMTSVAVNTEKELIAVAVQASGYADNGKVIFLNYDNEIVGIADAGVQPDMLTFTPDGSKVLVANEGEPREGYGDGTTDPKGSISVINIAGGAEQAETAEVTFEAWDAKREELVENGVIIKKNTNPSVDLEPEYIAVGAAGTKAYVSLQEANAIATVDLTTNQVTSIRSLGFKDSSVEKNALDLIKDKKIDIRTEDVMQIYMPDGISVAELNGKEYLLTANEGDSREWGDYSNEKEIQVRGEDVVTFDVSDYDGLDESKTYLFGARSFAIYDADTMEQVYESGSDFETKTAEYLPEYFNCSNDKIKLDNRSGKKGPEPETVVTGQVGEKTYAFIGLERIGGVMVYDITNPEKSSFVNYMNSRDFSDDIAGDVSPEGICFVPASQTVSEKAELFVANEVSGTAAIYQLTEQKTDSEEGGNQNDGKPGEGTEEGTDKEDSKPNGEAGKGDGVDKDTDKNNSKPGIVQTGDGAAPAVWFAGVIISLFAAVCVAKRHKKC